MIFTYKYFRCSAIVLVSFSLSFLSCEKEEKGFGKYLLSINNPTDKDYEIDVFLDNEIKGTFNIQANQDATYLRNCNDYGAENLVNVITIDLVPKGEHTISIKSTDETILTATKVNIQNDECVLQTISVAKVE